MRRTEGRFVLVVALVLAACGLGAMAGCSDDNKEETPSSVSDGGTTDGPSSNPGTDSGPGPGTDGGKGDAAQPDAGLLFTDYVKDLVQNHTANDTTPDDVYSHAFVTPDPEDPSAFPASFF